MMLNLFQTVQPKISKRGGVGLTDVIGDQLAALNGMEQSEIRNFDDFAQLAHGNQRDKMRDADLTLSIGKKDVIKSLIRIPSCRRRSVDDPWPEGMFNQVSM